MCFDLAAKLIFLSVCLVLQSNAIMSTYMADFLNGTLKKPEIIMAPLKISGILHFFRSYNSIIRHDTKVALLP